MSEKKKSTILRELLNAEEILVSIWGGTAHHAQLAETCGFKAFGVSGSHTSSQVLGLPDAGFLTQTELVENVQRICRAVRIPVIVDCDTGFGNAINVRRTVELVIRAGAAGCFIEDQTSPKRCGFVKGKQLVPVEEAVGKYRAACDVRDELDPDFIVMARTDARGAVGGSLEEVIRRGKAYLAAGVDVLYCEALQSREEVRTVRDAIPGALIRATEHAIKPPLTRQEKQELGLCMTGQHIPRIGAVAMYNFLKDYMEREEEPWIEWQQETADHPIGGYRMFDMTGFPQVVEWEQKYLPAETLDKYESSIGVYDPRDALKGKAPAGGK